MRLLYAGVDTFDFAINGALAVDDLSRLQTAKELATAWQAPTLTEIGPGRVAVQVAEHGRRGGYAYTFHTGPLGAVYAFKENTDPAQWNGFVSLRASALAAFGYTWARAVVMDQLRAMGCAVGQVSVARVDYAMDFLALDFVLDPARFVAHPHARVRPYWGDRPPQDPFQPGAIFRGRNVESVTIGKMPGRQIIVYDKRRAVVQKNEAFWFEVWKLNPKDADAHVWRVEVRAGKRELKERWQARSFAVLDGVLGDIVREILGSIRYVAPHQTDSNITRQALDPIWSAAMNASRTGLVDSTNGLLPSRVLELERDRAREIYSRQITGNAAGLAVALGIQDAELPQLLPTAVGRLLGAQIRTPRSALRRGVARARDRLHFLYGLGDEP